ncbi:MAG: hypothetical protein H0T92_18450 [Pyrinomonadaceae bacterium]|nr:hypothetical protein [Pyrinomonadaceae bacterium]
MSQKLELPDEVYSALVEAAKDTGITPADWISEKLPKFRVVVSDEERRADDARLEQHTVSLGYATGIDNESIESDLAREYGDDHRDLYHK